MNSTWTGDWKKRIKERVQRLGYANVLEFAEAHPGVPFGQLFRFMRETETLDDTPIAYSQFQAVYFEEAEIQGGLRKCVADTLVRRLRQHLGRGWNRGKKIKEKRAQAFTQWELPLGNSDKISVISNEIWKALCKLNPPDDWCPANVNDPLIRKAFEMVWPIDEQ